MRLHDLVLAHQDDILNRYIPPLTGRFIFCATVGVTEERQYEVVSKPGAVMPRIQERNGLAVQFLDGPSNTTLDAIRDRYRVDAVAVNPQRYDPDDMAAAVGGTVEYSGASYALVRLPPREG